MCRWLVDPKADSTVHIQRAVALLLDDYRNRRAWEYDLGVAPDAPFGEGKTGAQRYADLLAARKAAKIEEVEVLNYTDMFGLYAGYRSPCNGRAMYRVLSGWAHGMGWTQGTANLEPVEDGPMVPGGRLGRFSANDDMSATYTRLGREARQDRTPRTDGLSRADSLSARPATRPRELAGTQGRDRRRLAESDRANRPECPVGALVRAHRRRPLVSHNCRMRPTDSNPRHSAWEADTLPTELLPLGSTHFIADGGSRTASSHGASCIGPFDRSIWRNRHLLVVQSTIVGRPLGPPGKTAERAGP